MAEKRSASSLLVVGLITAVLVLVAVVAFLTGILTGRGQAPVAASSTPATVAPTSASAEPSTAPPSSADPTTPSPPAGIVQLQCSGPGLGTLGAQKADGNLVVELGLTAPLTDGQMLELLLDLDGDELYDQLVTYEADTGSSHLWDGEDEFDFLVVPSSIEDGVYRVSVPLVELQPSGPIHILANRINDQGEDGSEPCSEEPLVVE